MDIESTLIGIIKTLSSKEHIEVTDLLIEDALLDSLAMVTLLIQIEDAFAIELDEADMNPFELKTVEDAVNLVKKYVENCDGNKS